MILKNHFHISIQELYNTVITTEKATKKQTKEKKKTKAKVSLYKTENEKEVKKEDQDNSESKIGDCIIVNIK